MRCPDCNKFVSFGECECEETYSEVDGETVSGDFRLYLPCADCGCELTEAESEFSTDVDHECDEDCEVLEGYDPEEDQFELDSVDYEVEERYEGTGRKRRRIYTVHIVAHLKCLRCGEEFAIDDTVDVEYSEFGSLVY